MNQDRRHRKRDKKTSMENTGLKHSMPDVVVAGSAVVGTSVVGSAVVGSAVVGSDVVWSAVEGSAVIGSAVVGAVGAIQSTYVFTLV